MTSTVDPLGGSFFLEHLTDAIESEAEALIRKIDAFGGMVAAIENGFARRLIDQAGYDWCMQIERNERIVVGVNDETDDEPIRMELMEVAEEVRQQEIDRLNQVKARRDLEAVKLRAGGRARGGA